ncbi:MAG TPA: DNA-3-methyladenine glycosylase [Longimicrobiales bacterium]
MTVCVPEGAAPPRSFYCRPAEEVARDLLGAVLVSTLDGRTTAGRIVETEAYVGPHDPASHAAARVGRTARNAAMFGPGGTAYVYRSYGIHWCVNVVTGPEGYPAAVLIRALEPIEGLAVMRERRGGRCADRELARGPGRLAQALGISGAQNGVRLEGPPLWIRAGPGVDPAMIEAGPRIGIRHAADWPLRFHLRGNPWVSR